VLDATNGDEVTGTAEANSTVTITDGNGNEIGSADADGAGNFTIPLTPAQADGTELTATATDAAGNSSAEASVTVDGVAPDAPVITTITDNAGAITGDLANNASTDDTTPTISGTAEANSTVTLSDGTTVLGTTTADGSGNWSITPETALVEGDYTFTATATDAAGNDSLTSAPSITITVDITAPDAPVLDATNGDEVTGTAEANSTVTITDGNGNEIGSADADGAGNFTIPLTPAQADGTELTATATDAAGNSSAEASVTVDGVAPDAPVITTITDNAGAITGDLANNASTDDTTPTISGTAEANSTVTLSDGTTVLGTTTADGSGNWSITPETALVEGDYTFTATATDAAGNDSLTSAPSITITVDITAPSATENSIAFIDGDDGLLDANEIGNVTLSGTIENGLDNSNIQLVITDNAGRSVAIEASDITVTGTTIAVDSQNLSDLAEGELTATLTVTDAAGNTAQFIDTSTKDASTNVAPTVVASNQQLLGLAGLDALNIIDLSQNNIFVADANNNLSSVTISFEPTVNLDLGQLLGTPELTVNQALAAELGLSAVSTSDSGILGLIAPSASVAITALDGGSIDNLNINELLSTLNFNQSDIVSLTLLEALTITAVDDLGASTTVTLSSLIDINLLDSAEDDTVFIDDEDIDILDLSSATENVNLYGLGGDDTLRGGSGNDLIRGGEGNDILNGGDGNDLLFGGAGTNTFEGGLGDDTIVTSTLTFDINGGLGTDTVQFDGTGESIDLVALSAQAEPSVMTNIEVLDISASSETGTSLKIDTDTVLNLTDGDNELYIDGDEGDSVEAAGATSSATTTEFNGTTYDTYQLGEATLYIDQDVTVNTSNG
ncbi:MAG: calcium-binding protein, partial [Gammaproteobacteria bacterium]|nr:calcium-binding protein [Gammaproteobacteria bacterium]